MTRNDAIELLPIIKAWSEGNEIEWCDGYGKWHKATDDLSFQMTPNNYRVIPKYVPFENADDAIGEMMNNFPFGYLKSKKFDYVICVKAIKDEGCMTPEDETIHTWKYMFDNYEFLNGGKVGKSNFQVSKLEGKC